MPPGVLNVCAKAGDVVVISERMLHGALRWQPKDRERRFLTCRCVCLLTICIPRALPSSGGVRATRRYNVQHNLTGSPDSAPFPDAVLSRLSPETIELASYAPCAQPLSHECTSAPLYARGT